MSRPRAVWLSEGAQGPQHRLYRPRIKLYGSVFLYRRTSTATLKSPSPCDWLPHQKYALFPPVIGSHREYALFPPAIGSRRRRRSRVPGAFTFVRST
eukprot:469696-Prorocentrum_minimum.AAC.2